MPSVTETAVHAVKTWRYLRLSMIVLVLGLGAAVVFEWREVGWDCMQTSISAYYYTPVRAFFVSSLLAIGVCMVAMKGNRETEDGLLNVAGMLAPVVGLVPTPGPGTCTSTPGTKQDPTANVVNNMSALFAVGLIAIVAVAVLVVVEWRRSGVRPPTTHWVGIGVSVAFWLAGALVFTMARKTFIDKAHYAAAIVMFVCIVGVVVFNAIDFKKKTAEGPVEKRDYANRYALVAWAMALSVVGMVGWELVFGWAHLVLGIEAALITLFAVFWAVQTEELWDEGLRPAEPSPPTRKARHG